MAVTAIEFAEHCRRYTADPVNKSKGWILMEWKDEYQDPGRCYVGMVIKDVRVIGMDGVMCDVSVCWHQVYRVPVLCFVAYYEDGTLVPFSKVVNKIRMPDGVSSESPILGQQPEAVISQGPHPVTDTFVLHVHPCETQSSLECMGVGSSSPHYLMSFLSIAGPILGLPIALCQPTPAPVPQTQPEIPDTDSIPVME